MDREGIRRHWQDWAERYGRGLRATTKAGTAKQLEVDALVRALRRHRPDVEAGAPITLLEVGCGNGHNALALARAFPGAHIAGVDLVEAMVERARENAAEAGLADRIEVAAGDVLELDSVPGLAARFDVLVSDRCLINLPSTELQKRALTALAARLAPGGLLLLVENSAQSHARQNDLREKTGLPRRTPAAFNHFLDEDEIVPHLESCLELLEVEDFISLHDLVLYVLVPATNGGEVDYDHPLVRAAADLSRALSPGERAQLGAFGQNRLFVGRRPVEGAR